MINWFSPVPSAKTEIAQYTSRLIQALLKQDDIRVYTSQREFDPLDCEVVRYTADNCPWSELNRARANIFHIGNNGQFHADIWEISRRHGGVVVLHDVVLQHLFAGYCVQSLRRPDKYTELMKTYYGTAGLRAASALLAGERKVDEVAIQYPLTLAAVENATGIVVHSRAALEIVRNMTLAPVAYAPLPHKVSRTARTERAAERKTGSDRQFRIVMFGHMGSNRRVEPFLQALHEIPESTLFSIDIYGSVWDHSRLVRTIHSLGMERLVKIHGYVRDLDERLAEADLAVNLRYPSMGEASAAQLRIWDHALPSLVTETGWYSELPRDAVLHVRPDYETEDIQQHLREFVKAPAAMARVGARGREILLQQHAIDPYVDTILKLAHTAAHFAPVAACFRATDRTGEELSRFLRFHTRELGAGAEDTLNSLATACVMKGV